MRYSLILLAHLLVSFWVIIFTNIYWSYISDSSITTVLLGVTCFISLVLPYQIRQCLKKSEQQINDCQFINQLIAQVPYHFFQYQITEQGIGNFYYLNQKNSSQQSIQRQKLSIDEVLSWISDEDKEKVKTLLANIPKKNTNILTTEFRVKKNNILQWVKVNAYIHIENNIHIVTGVIESINEQKQVEIALKKSEERFELAVLGTSCGLWDWGNTFEDRAWWSSRFFELLGYTENEIEPSLSRLTNLLHPEDHPLVTEALTQHLQAQKPFDIDCRLRMKTGEYRWFHLLGQAVWNNAGNATRMAGSLTDITERKLTELALHKSMEQFRTLVENGSDWVWEFNQHLVITMISDNVRKVLGYEPVELMGRHFFTLIPQHELKKFHTIFNIDKKIYLPLKHEEIQFRRKDGVSLLIEITAVPFFDTHHQFLGYFGMGRDITLQRQNYELSIENKELAKTTRLKDEFLATMSHELRTPLNAILGMAEALQENVYGTLEPRQVKSIQIIESSGKHLLSLINDILDLSKIEAGKMHLTFGDVVLDSLCQQCIDFIRPQAMKKNIRLKLNINSSIMTIQADRQRLRQIIINLLNNAVKFTPDNGEVGLELKNDDANKQVHISVWDTGIGIAEADRIKLFKPFSQIDSRLSRQYEGTGLGLALIYRLTLLHGGYVSVESEFGKGSRFIISLYETPPLL
ncbi:PAS domain S-box [Beggiatoa alba B18LD]|uniref:histidine kinase n=1 Tax=Beggiatoa alba B18LD TaxID=395493 RepID=I3CHH6_9GAMM|nr:PAS domain-containing sensor histidine kinase [Beggiatoa alba]EIJ43069.1 PAS domain S-box [Beggiatoa alba B18LD]